MNNTQKTPKVNRYIIIFSIVALVNGFYLIVFQNDSAKMHKVDQKMTLSYESELKDESDEKDGSVPEYCWTNMTSIFKNNAHTIMTTTENTNPNYNNNKSAVVFLLGFARSGTTFASDLFFSTTNIFFLDEPMRAVMELRNESVSLKGLQVLDYAYNLIGNCHLSHAFTPTYNAQFLELALMRYDYYKNPNLNALSWLENGLKQSKKLSQEPKGRKALLHKFESSCKNSTIAAMKEIRILDRYRSSCDHFQISSLHYLLSKYANAKVIHLVRHPEEVLESEEIMSFIKPARSKIKNPTIEDVRTNIRQDRLNKFESKFDGKCFQTLQDMVEGETWNNRYLFIRYQDMISEPLQTTLKVHAFMGINHYNGTTNVARIKNFISEHIVSSSESSHSNEFFSTKRPSMTCSNDCNKDGSNSRLGRNCQEVIQRGTLECCQ